MSRWQVIGLIAPCSLRLFFPPEHSQSLARLRFHYDVEDGNFGRAITKTLRGSAVAIQPATSQDVREALATAFAQGVKAPAIGLSRLHRIIEYTPEDMTVTVEAGITLAALQAHLGRHGQWLPIDPPCAERLTIGKLLSTNASGPRRFGYGTIREHLIGITVALADGRAVNAGGKVVKNVAGYDLCKLFVGSVESLGVIVQATFKLRPLPEAEQFVQKQCESLEQAGALIEAVIESELTPVVLDLHNQPSASGPRLSTFFVVLGFAGTREEVEWQLARGRELSVSEPSSLEYETRFWTETALSMPRRLSVLPSRVSQAIGGLGDVTLVARAGNGVIYYRPDRSGEPPKDELPDELMQRVKDAYDPKHILPELPL